AAGCRPAHPGPDFQCCGPIISWPRISPPGLFAVATLTYQRPASRSSICDCDSVTTPLSVALPVTGMVAATAPFSPGIAGPWNDAPVGGPVRPLRAKVHFSVRLPLSSVAWKSPLPLLSVGGTSLAPDRREVSPATLFDA